MELRPDDISNLKRLVTKWVQQANLELEATFRNASDTTTFLAIAQRLKAKGFEALPQEDRMNIITPQRVRFTLTGMSAVEEYCKTDSLEDIDYDAMIKDITEPESSIDIDEYGFRVKIRREIDITKDDSQVVTLLSRWNEQSKAFRLMRRWSFLGKDIRIDMSMVRSTPTNNRGDYMWQKSFRDRDLTKAPAKFEVEVELLRPEKVDISPEYQDIAFKQLIVGIGEVLRGIQKHSFLIRKSVSKRVLEEYSGVVGSSSFRGVAPVTLEKQNVIKTVEKKIPNIRTGYNVTDKADGLRMLGFVDEKGELFMIDMSMTVYRTGLKKSECRNSLVDGEYVTRDREGNPLSQFLIFDIYYAPDKKDVTKETFAGEGGSNAASEPSGRYGRLMEWIARWSSNDGPAIIPGSGVTNKNKIIVLPKVFKFANAGDDTIFGACASVLDSSTLYYTDGLILTPNSLPLPNRPGAFQEQFKWKPAEDNTVDFLVVMDKDPDMPQVDLVNVGVKPETGETTRYKTLYLYVAADRDPTFQDPRATVLFERPLPGAYDRPGKNKMQPVLFSPKELPDTMANVSYRVVEEDYITHEEICMCENGDPIQDRSIVECKYNDHAPPGWRWTPMRIRYDKTERYQRGEKGGIMNRDFTAESVWNSIHDPVTHHMIRTGAEAPSTDELKAMSGEVAGVVSGEVSKIYYDRKAAKEDIKLIQGLRQFHRLYVKDGLLLATGLKGGNKTFVDLACGQGGDIQSWIRFGASFCYGTDVAGFGIRDPQNGAYRRYLNTVIRSGGYDEIPKMIFTIGSSSKRLATGEAGATEQEADIMRSIFGVVAPTGAAMPPFVKKYGTNRLREGADCVACMFAIHYFFENEESLYGILQNISDSLKVGGLFVGCCFDGQRIFDALRSVPTDGSLVGKEKDAEIWRITKRYSAENLVSEPVSEGVGLGIDVEFISIGTTQREYLVPFKLLERKMADIGCDLLTPSECKDLGLRHSTATFDESYEMAKKSGKVYDMAEDVKRYSFFNRWFIFKRRRTGPLSGEDDDETTMAAREEEEKAEQILKERRAAVASATGTAVTKAVSANAKADEEREIAIRTVMTAAKEGEKGSVSVKSKPTVAPLEADSAAVLSKILLFAHDTDKTKDQLGIKVADEKGKMKADKYAVRWLAPIAPFPIKDSETDVDYPSVEHYLAAMKVKIAGKNPELAQTLFSREGTIHQYYLNQRAIQTAQGTKPLTEEADQTLLKEERQRVLKDSDNNELRKKYKVVIDEGAWLVVRDKVLEEAIQQRWTKDERFRMIVNTAKSQGFYILHYGGPAGGSWLGGKKAVGNKIEGGNALGKAIMKAAGFSKSMLDI